MSASGEWDARQRHFADILPRASFIVTGTHVGKGQVESLFGVPPERVVVLPMATPSDALDHRAVSARETAHRLGLNEKFVLYPAQFWPHKNHVTLLRAIQVLGERHGTRPLLALTGSDQGNVSHVLARAQAMGIGDQVRYFGFVPRAELLDLYTVAAALAYPSLFGPDNIPPLEAFALGCPVVAGRIEGAREQFGDAARLVDPLDPEQWADALFRVLGDPSERTRLVSAGRERAALWTNADAAAGLLREVDRFAAINALWP